MYSNFVSVWRVSPTKYVYGKSDNNSLGLRRHVGQKCSGKHLLALFQLMRRWAVELRGLGTFLYSPRTLHHSGKYTLASTTMRE